ncbi:uncharacterized protein LOC132381986 [Hypanus sabinus]|uniref:uncharacterized protein LOC132381986 n=1 Tax=Hypanus sabinus TaxID=79690 RepID=UPI0028C45E51|nr:uncharacterized protein LOC132381986 [Hypanus sabinus]XP_059807713.1 uncharacterized protein LOC132381986 [Hypanus sabinus]XP_059807714.1 uncharacterized protein LOC132381986 [Hypanus sabinus]XP_059807715.1 uncharacterized protein LOC132381986 [Hypanus sabinus]
MSLVMQRSSDYPLPSTITLLRLEELVLTLNNFSFGSSHFLQTKGVAMSTCMGPSYACLFVGFVEQSMFQVYTGIHTLLFLRYIDDYIGAASCKHAELVDFINFVSNFHAALKFTWSISDTSLPFLDLSVSISGDGLSTDIYYKPTDSHSYLDYSSSHPVSIKNAIPFLQFLRLRFICSQDEAFHSRTKEMSSFFKQKGFPSSTINSALKRISPISRTSALTLSAHHPTRHRVPLILTYHPTSLQVQRIILCNFRHLQRDPTTKHIFPSPPFLLYAGIAPYMTPLSTRSPPSLPTDLPPGTYPCKWNKCYTCPYTSSLTTIQGPRQSFQVR